MTNPLSNSPWNKHIPITNELLRQDREAMAEPITNPQSILTIVTPERVARVHKCIEIVMNYGHFRSGQDGFQALKELQEFTLELKGVSVPYGFCPHCAAPGISRERRPNGNDECKNGHRYPSRSAR